MKIGVPKEIKNNEFRVGLTPDGARILTRAGHHVRIQKNAGEGSGMSDEEYASAGAELVDTLEDVYSGSEMIIKVKEPLPEEYPLIQENQILFAYLHLAPAPELTHALRESGCIAVAYETVQTPDGQLPLLHPMSEVAGRIAPQVGAYYLEKANGGKGILLGGVPGVPRGTLTILGGGTVGLNACKIATGLGANVMILDINLKRLAFLDDLFGNAVTTVMATPDNIHRLVTVSDVVVGAVLIPGAKAPCLVTREMISGMVKGSVLVDISIDQGGCSETSHPTTHQAPTYITEGVIHYCVTNIPGAVPRTSTFALTNATLPYVLSIADQGISEATQKDKALAKGVNVYKGSITCKGVAEAVNDRFVNIETLLF
jgi:alanine dehydrogenase